MKKHRQDNAIRKTKGRFLPAIKARAYAIQPWVIYLVGILFYCFAYFLRVYPGIYGGVIQAQLGIGVKMFGVLAAMYYFAYAPMQLPVGVCVDKLGPRFSLLFACAASLIGAYFFASSHWLWLSVCGRFLVGFGTAFAYVTALKLAAMWLPEKYFATATGAVTACGMIAAAVSYDTLGKVKNKTSSALVSSVGHTGSAMLPVYIGMGLLLLIFLLVRNRQSSTMENGEEASAVSFDQLKSYIKDIIGHRQIWLIGLIGCCLYLPSSVFLDLYAKNFLTKVEALSSSQAGTAILLMYVGWILSSVISGHFSDRLQNRKKPLVLSCFLAFFFSSLLIFVTAWSSTMVFVLMFLFGVSCGPHPLCFTMSKENCVAKVAGTAIAFANFLIMMGGFLFQPVVAILIQWHHKHAVNPACWPVLGGFNGQDYRVALMFMPFVLLLAFFVSFALKETGGSRHNKG
jgi:MFS family permease